MLCNFFIYCIYYIIVVINLTPDVQWGQTLCPYIRSQQHRFPSRIFPQAHARLQNDIQQASSRSVGFCRDVLFGPHMLSSNLWGHHIGHLLEHLKHALVDLSNVCPLSHTGILTFVLLNTTGLSPPARADRLELMSITGNVMKTLPIRYFPERRPYGIWNITEFVPPKEAFFLRVTGYDRDGFVFQRVSSVSYSSIVPGQMSDQTRVNSVWVLCVLVLLVLLEPFFL